MSATECVRVAVRCRPMNSKEKSMSCDKIVQVDKKLLQITLHKPNNKQTTTDDNTTEKTFTFDSVFDDDSLQSDVYAETAYGLVESVMEGYNGTIFAYGRLLH